jgi:hypothetical protein
MPGGEEDFLAIGASLGDVIGQAGEDAAGVAHAHLVGVIADISQRDGADC